MHGCATPTHLKNKPCVNGKLKQNTIFGKQLKTKPCVNGKLKHNRNNPNIFHWIVSMETPSCCQNNGYNPNIFHWVVSMDTASCCQIGSCTIDV